MGLNRRPSYPLPSPDPNKRCEVPLYTLSARSGRVLRSDPCPWWGAQVSTPKLPRRTSIFVNSSTGMTVAASTATITQSIHGKL